MNTTPKRVANKTELAVIMPTMYTVAGATQRNRFLKRTLSTKKLAEVMAACKKISSGGGELVHELVYQVFVAMAGPKGLGATVGLRMAVRNDFLRPAKDGEDGLTGKQWLGRFRSALNRGFLVKKNLSVRMDRIRRAVLLPSQYAKQVPFGATVVVETAVEEDAGAEAEANEAPEVISLEEEDDEEDSDTKTDNEGEAEADEDEEEDGEEEEEDGEDEEEEEGEEEDVEVRAPPAANRVSSPKQQAPPPSAKTSDRRCAGAKATASNTPGPSSDTAPTAAQKREQRTQGTARKGSGKKARTSEAPVAAAAPFVLPPGVSPKAFRKAMDLIAAMATQLK